MNELTIIKGYKGTVQYNKKFVRIFYHNIVGNQQNLFRNDKEANFSRFPKRFSVLKYIDANFIISNKYEFLLYYEELNKSLHWEQTRSIHLNSTNTGYNKLNVDDDQTEFNGLGLTGTDESYIDGVPQTSNWWYSIGTKKLHKNSQGYTGIPGPSHPIDYVVNITSLWIRIDNEKVLERLPSLINKISCKITKRSSNIAIIILIMISSK